MWSVRVHTYTNTHTTECTKAAKATTPSARCIPGWKVSPCGLSPICVTVGVRPASHPAVSSQEPTQVTLHQPEHNHLPCCISIQLNHTFIQLLWSFRRNHNGNKKEKKQPSSTFIVHSTMTTSVWLVFPNNNKDSSLGVRMCGKTLKVAWQGNVSILVQQLHWCTLFALLGNSNSRFQILFPKMSK